MRLTVLAAAAAAFAALAAASGAAGFVVEAPGEGSGDPLLDLAQAARWDMNPGSLVATGERGLGGGLEYAVDDSVCTELTFADDPGCAAVKAVIAEAFRRWGLGHPAISFTDVTGNIAPELAPHYEAWVGHGAEIDLFAVSGATLARDHDEEVAADTRSYYMFTPVPRDPEGRPQRAARGRITAADIRINTDVCFVLDPDAEAAGCVHFGSVVMHEIAHALGLDHPDEHPERNLAAGAPAAGCDGGIAGLTRSPETERYAVADGRWTGAGYWTRGLSADDYAGRNALYPACAIARVAAVQGGARRWAAFALSSGAGAGNAFGWARDSRTQAEARESAREACARYGQSCTVAAVFTDCFAFARGASGSWGWAVRSDLASARAGAEANCARDGGSCQAPIALCAAEADG